jgi:hypothetical protein
MEAAQRLSLLMVNRRHIMLSAVRKATSTILAAAFVLVVEASASIKTAGDGFPTGAETPEGAACDFFRAIIHRDPVMFLDICLKPYGDPSTRRNYEQYLQSAISQMKQEASLSEPSPLGPRSIETCYAARHLTAIGPASYGQTSLGFDDVMFVDLKVNLQNGNSQFYRTLLLQKNKRWSVHPQPDLSPLLISGLAEESKSHETFADTDRPR